MGGAAGEVGGKLHGALFSANNLQPRLPFRLEGVVDEELERLLVAPVLAVHAMVEERIADGPQVKLQLHQP